MKNAVKRVRDRIKLYFHRRRLIRDWLNDVANNLIADEQFTQLKLIVDNGTDTIDLHSLEKTTYPLINQQPNDNVLTEQQLDELVAEIEQTSPLIPQINEKQLKLDIINRRLNQGA